MTMLKRVAAVLLAIATLLTFAACRTKDEAAFTFSNGTDKVKIRTALYMCYLIDATGEFQSEYDTQAAETTEASEETTSRGMQASAGQVFATWIFCCSC